MKNLTADKLEGIISKRLKANRLSRWTDPSFDWDTMGMYLGVTYVTGEGRKGKGVGVENAGQRLIFSDIEEAKRFIEQEIVAKRPAPKRL